MGWVTLTLRKTELKRSHSDYQMELLSISRTKRQMARQYHYQQTSARSEGNTAVREAQTEYMSAFDTYREAAKASRNSSSNSGGNTGNNNSNSNNGSTYSALDDARDALEAAKLKYERDKMDAQTIMEDELARLEQEANDTETMLDQEQVEVEAQLEAISAEIEAVGSAISQQVQASTIKLA